tara:strand:+ start:1889 stop:2659 length:771 start_codon:yes stop_codon:yes gene_type:complete
MSQLQVDNIYNKDGTGAPTFPNGAIFPEGVVVSGILTASTIGSATDTTTFPGNIVVQGTQTIINYDDFNVKDKTIGISSTASPTDTTADGAGIEIYGTTHKKLTYNNTKKGFEFNVPLSTEETRIVTASEKVVHATGNTVGLQYNSGGNIAVVTGSSGDITLNVESIPETADFDNNAISFSLAIVQAGTARSCTTVNLNGYTAPIRWAGGSLASAISGLTTSSGMDVYSFTGINTVGSAATCTNYYLLGAVNGGYA